MYLDEMRIKPYREIWEVNMKPKNRGEQTNE